MTKKNRATDGVSDSRANNVWSFGPAISRREFLVTGASLVTVAALPPALAGDLGHHAVRMRRSRRGLLETTLKVELARNRIPQWDLVTRTDNNGRVRFTKELVRAWEVFTRTYEGDIPGPVLHLSRGDVLRIRHINRIPPGFPPTGLPVQDVNIPHEFNITNLHTHGLSVSPRCDFDDQGNIIKCSDNVLVDIPPGEFLDYEYEIPDDHPDGTFWYHPHNHGSVAFQMMGGMQGAIIIAGPTNAFLKDRGVRKDKVFVLQQIRVKDDGKVLVDNFLDFVDPPLYTVNGELNPVIHIRPGEVQRWRFIHGGMSEHIPLQLLNEYGEPQPLYQMASDGITFSKPVKSQLVFWGRIDGGLKAPELGIFMASGNRADVLIKCDEPGVYQLIKPEFDQGFAEGPIPAVPNPEIPGQAVPIATVICTGRPAEATWTEDDLLELNLPTPLEDIRAEDITGTRTLEFALDPASFDPPDFQTPPFPRFLIGGRYGLDGQDKIVPLPAVGPEENPLPCAMLPHPCQLLQFDPDRVDQVIKEGAVEEWTVYNFSSVDHPFHIHQVSFLVTEIKDPRLSEGEQEIIKNTLPRWQDVQNIPGGGNSDFPSDLISPDDPRFIPGSITFRIRFEGGIFEHAKTSIAGDFVVHCHILDHEDTGMMQLIRVEP